MNNPVELNNFQDIKDPYLRAFNRVQVVYSLNADGRKHTALQYMKPFSEADKVAMGMVTKDIRELGFTQVRKNIVLKTNFTDDFIEEVA